MAFVYPKGFSNIRKVFGYAMTLRLTHKHSSNWLIMDMPLGLCLYSKVYHKCIVLGMPWLILLFLTLSTIVSPMVVAQGESVPFAPPLPSYAPAGIFDVESTSISVFIRKALKNRRQFDVESTLKFLFCPTVTDFLTSNINFWTLYDLMT